MASAVTALRWPAPSGNEDKVVAAQNKRKDVASQTVCSCVSHTVRAAKGAAVETGLDVEGVNPPRRVADHDKVAARRQRHCL